MDVWIKKSEKVHLSKEVCREVAIKEIKRISGLSYFEYVKDGFVYRDESDYHTSWNKRIRKASELEESSFKLISLLEKEGFL